MALELRQQLKLSQQLIMTPQLQMAIKLLQLSRLELLDTIRQELEENPALEEVGENPGDEMPVEPSDEGEHDEAPPEADLREVTIEEKINEEIDWSNYIEEYNAPGRGLMETEKREIPSFEAFVARKESLYDHLLWQLLMTRPSPEEESIGSLIAGSVTPDGYLETPVEELALTAGVEVEVVAKTLAVMQTFDPVGVCARNLSECLMLQARHLEIGDPLVEAIIDRHLHHLENRNFKAICRETRASLETVLAAVGLIRKLDPRPGRQFSDEEPQYITPDIYVHKLGDEFVIMLNDDGLPRLRVNAFYRNSMRRGQPISTPARDYVQEKMRSAAWLIRSIHQRQKTIYRVMESILKYQSAFFDQGIAHLKPMVLRDVAEDIGMHESTISRVTTNKYAHTPQGIFELKYFFNSSIRRVQGEDIASASVQQKIRQIIEGEDPHNPHSDEKIAQILEAQNIDIARRTVAKYREMMRILPSNKRKQY
jgi:RNA polymerase sigma-54 factor